MSRSTMSNACKLSWQVVTLLFLSVGCSIEAPIVVYGQAVIGTVHGTVTDSHSGNPVTRATVKVSNESVITDAQGIFRVDSLKVGTTKITASAAGYMAFSGQVSVQAGAIVFDIELIPISTGDTTAPTVVSTIPQSAPTVVSTIPQSEAPGVPIHTAISATFSEPMAASSLNSTTVILTMGAVAVSGAVTATSNQVYFKPTVPLSYSTRYTVSITTGAKDEEGNPVATELNWSFDTQAQDLIRPNFIASSPSHRSTGNGEVSQLTITFDEPMSEASFQQGSIDLLDSEGKYVGFSSAVLNENLVIYLDNPLSQGSYTVAISETVSDIAGNTLLEKVKIEFATFGIEDITPGGASGYVGSFRVNYLSPSTIYVGTFNGGFWRSEDSGSTWSQIGVAANSTFSSLTIDPITPTTLYGHLWGGLSGWATGFYKTTDGGENWSPVNSGLPTANNSRQFSSLSIDPIQPTTLYVEMHSSDGSQPSILYKSKNGGASWSSLPATGYTSVYASSIAVHPVTNSTIFLAGNYLFRSLDGGQTWEKEQDIWATATSILFYPDDPQIMFATSNGGPYKSFNGGNTWEQRGHGSEQSLAMVIDPSNHDVLYSGGTNGHIFRSNDRSETWLWIAKLPENHEVYQLGINPGGYLFAKGNGRLFRLPK